VNPLLIALVYAAVGIALLPACLAFFKVPYKFVDVALASIGGAACSLIPTIGGPASLAALIAILHWRLNARLFPDILIPALVARLAMVPVLLVMR
jgi:hypothetical protein